MGKQTRSLNPDEVETVGFEDIRWRPSVESEADLPTEDNREGDMCLVTEGQTVFEFRDGRWTREVVVGVLLD